MTDTGSTVTDLLIDVEQGTASNVEQAYAALYVGLAVLIGVLLLCCLGRAVKGPRIADRVIAVNMTGTMTVILICVLAFLLREPYLMDIAMIYTMLSFLAVVLLTRIFMGVYRQKRHEERESTDSEAGEAEKDA